MASRPPFVRLCLLDRALASPGGLSVRSFAAEHEVCRRTVLRDLDLIRDRFGLALDFDGRRWRYAPDSGPLFTEAARARAL